jgi:hypothetical protein
MSTAEKSQGDAGDARSPQTREEACVVAFESPSPPTLVATSPYQMTLQWKQLAPRTEADAPRIESLAPRFALMMKLVCSPTFLGSIGWCLLL